MGQHLAVNLGINPAELARFESAVDRTLSRQAQHAAEERALGHRAAERKANITRFLDETLLPTEAAAVKAACTTAGAIALVESKMETVALRRWYGGK